MIFLKLKLDVTPIKFTYFKFMKNELGFTTWHEWRGPNLSEWRL